jgi:hypothetical protein
MVMPGPIGLKNIALSPAGSALGLDVSASLDQQLADQANERKKRLAEMAAGSQPMDAISQLLGGPNGGQ